MKYQFIGEHQGLWPLRPLCRVLGVSRAGFHRHNRALVSARARTDVALLGHIRTCQGEGRGSYGSPRIHAALRSRGIRCSRKRVARLMTAAGIRSNRSRHRWVRTTDSRHGFAVAPNLLQRQFRVATVNQVWVADTTFISTQAGWLYCASILDLCSRRVVGWSLSDTNDTILVSAALRMAIRRRRPLAGLIHHSDRGSSYASHAYQAQLRDHGIRPSMSRRGDCWDNAPMESFHASLKEECLHHQTFRTHDQAALAVFDYIETFYNRTRRHSALGYVSPEQAERVA